MAYNLKSDAARTSGLADSSEALISPDGEDRPYPYAMLAVYRYIAAKIVGDAPADLDTLAEIAAALALKAPAASPSFTGTPSAPTAAPGTNTNQIATTAFVAAAVAALINSAPGVLDTLDELAAALGDDANFAATTATALNGKLAKASNLSDVASVSAARSNLGLGVLATASSITASQISDSTSLGRSLLTAANHAGLVSALALVASDIPDLSGTYLTTSAGAGFQPLDATLTSLAAVSTAADKLIYATGPDTFATSDVTAAARTLIGQPTQALMRTTGLGMSANGSSLVTAADYPAMKGLLAIAQSDVANLTSDLALKAPLASPAFTGTPTAPTATIGTNTTQIATTAFVRTAISAGVGVQGFYNASYQLSPTAGSNLANGTYDAFGITAIAPSGKVLIIYRQASTHVGAGDYGVIRKRTSDDGGRTWSSATTIASASGEDLRNVGGGFTPTGRLIVAYKRYNPDTSADIDDAYIYSDDEGVTWTSPAPLSPSGLNNPYGPLIAIGSGKILQTVYGANKARCLISSDNGATWGSAIDIGGASPTTSEASAVYVGGNMIVVLARVEAGSGTVAFRQYVSTDNGTTWSDQGATTFDDWSYAYGHPPWLQRFRGSDGRLRLVCYYLDRDVGTLKAVYGDAADVVAGVSGWDTNSKVTIASGLLVGGAGYPAVIHPHDNPIGIGWYYNETIVNDETEIATLITPRTFPSNVGGALGVGTNKPKARLHVAPASQLSAVPAAGATSMDVGLLLTQPDGLYGLLAGNLNSGVAFLQAQRVDGTATTYALNLQPNGGAAQVAGDTIATLTATQTLSNKTLSSPTIATPTISGSATMSAGHVTFNHGYGFLWGSTGVFAYSSTPGSHAIFLQIEGSEKVRLTSTGLGILTNSPSQGLDVNEDSIRVRTAKTPSSASATGTQGQIAWDSSYIYVCTATNTWRRVAHATW